MFLHVSVILFTGGGGGIPACIEGGIPACLVAGLQEEFPDPHPGVSPGPHLGGGVSRPTPGGTCLQADPP